MTSPHFSISFQHLNRLSLQHLMELPEIRNAVGLFLSKKTLAACARVCKVWHASYIPLLYASLDVFTRQEQIPAAMAFALYGRFLKELSLEFIHAQIHAISTTCHNIRRLHIDLTKIKSKHQDPLFRLLQSNPWIQELKIEKDQFDRLEAPPSIARDILMRCTAVTSVTLLGFELSREDMGTLWTLSEQLVELRLDGNSPNSLESIWEYDERPWPTFPKLELLELCWLLHELAPDAQVRWIGQCPSLKKLVWILRQSEYMLTRPPHDPAGTKFSQEWGRLFASACCPVLTSVEILGSTFKDTHLQTMLEQSPAHLTHLHIRLFRFPELATDGWRRHFGTLVSLCLLPGDLKEHWVSQIIMSSCPQLEEFVGTTLFLSDGSSADPWVCYKLRHLTIRICTTDTPQMRQEILDRLIQLKNLKTLVIKASSDWFVPNTEYRLPRYGSRDTAGELQSNEEADHDQRLFENSNSLSRRPYPTKPKQRWVQKAWPKLRHLDCRVCYQ